MKISKPDQRSISTVALAVVVIVIIVVVGVGGYFLLVAPKSSSTTTLASTSTSSISLASSTATSSTNSTVTVVFGATLSMTGPLEAFGQEQNWTLNYAINYVNSLGGIPLSNGQHALIKLVVLDDQSMASIGATNLNSLISTYHAQVILGELGGVQDSVAQTFATQNQIPYIGPVYISNYKTCTTNCSSSWIFSPFENETNEAHVFLNWFKTVDPPTSGHSPIIAFFGEGDAAAAANNAAGEAYASQLGYTKCTCSDTSFTPLSSSEMQTFITSAKQDGAEAVYGLPLPPDASLMLTTAQSLNYTPKAWMLTRGTAVEGFALPAAGGVGNESSGFMTAFPWNPLVPYNGVILGHTVSNAQIVTAYEDHWHFPPTLEGVYYTEALVAVDAIAQAGSLNNTAVRTALRSMTFSTPMGQVTFTQGGQWKQSDQDILLMQWQNKVINGTTTAVIQILEPTTIATTNYIIYPFSYQNAKNTATQQQQTWPPVVTTNSG
jgi:branched-chain amino acid transport system substrate-binding protein